MQKLLQSLCFLDERRNVTDLTDTLLLQLLLLHTPLANTHPEFDKVIALLLTLCSS